jgi:hypothetical protein
LLKGGQGKYLFIVYINKFIWKVNFYLEIRPPFGATPGPLEVFTYEKEVSMATKPSFLICTRDVDARGEFLPEPHAAAALFLGHGPATPTLVVESRLTWYLHSYSLNRPIRFRLLAHHYQNVFLQMPSLQ